MCLYTATHHKTCTHTTFDLYLFCRAVYDELDRINDPREMESQSEIPIGSRTIGSGLGLGIGIGIGSEGDPIIVDDNEDEDEDEDGEGDDKDSSSMDRPNSGTFRRSCLRSLSSQSAGVMRHRTTPYTTLKPNSVSNSNSNSNSNSRSSRPKAKLEPKSKSKSKSKSKPVSMSTAPAAATAPVNCSSYLPFNPPDCEPRVGMGMGNVVRWSWVGGCCPDCSCLYRR